MTASHPRHNCFSPNECRARRTYLNGGQAAGPHQPLARRRVSVQVRTRQGRWNELHAAAHTSLFKAIEEGYGDKAVVIQMASKKAWIAELEEMIDRLKLRYFIYKEDP